MTALSEMESRGSATGMELRKLSATTAELDIGQIEAAPAARKQQIVTSPDYLKQNEKAFKKFNFN